MNLTKILSKKKILRTYVRTYVRTYANQFNRFMSVLSNESLESTHQNSSLPSNIIMVIFFLKKIIYVLILSLSSLYIRLKNRYKNNHAIFAST
ncbi:hypothetical protein, partial [Borreliella garinii]|uniref:hypothetical protein n=1 Tax=Borreliella garinii TaxID=29519 RepID=UPI001AF00A71